MRFHPLGYLAVLILVSVGCVTQTSAPRPEVRVKGWSGNERFEYQADTYVAAAFHLQALDHLAAAELLKLMARSSNPDDDAVFILCRMLFTNHPTAEFRRPMIGGGVFLGGSDFGDWPLDPIEIVDGIPFLVSRRGLLSGLAESNTEYLQYCLTTCEWNPFRFTPRSAEEKSAALEKLLASPKWRRPLTEPERQSLELQIR